MINREVCAIVVTYRIGKDLLKCCDSVKDQVGETVIVDNGSDNETLEVLRNLEETRFDIKVFYNQENLGIAAALNIGVKYALIKGYNWVLTLDHDSEAAPQMVNRLLHDYQTLKGQHVENIGILAAIPFDLNGKEYLVSENLFARDCQIKRVEIVISSGSLINCCVFEQIGFFNESLFIYYVDDDFCLRCKQNNWNIYLCRSPLLFHREGVREIKKLLGIGWSYQNYGPYARYYLSRNAIYMMKKYITSYRYCYTLIKRLITDTIKILLFDKDKRILLSFTGKGIVDGITGKFGKLIIGHNPKLYFKKLKS